MNYDWTRGFKVWLPYTFPFHLIIIELKQPLCIRLFNKTTKVYNLKYYTTYLNITSVIQTSHRSILQITNFITIWYVVQKFWNEKKFKDYLKLYLLWSIYMASTSFKCRIVLFERPRYRSWLNCSKLRVISIVSLFLKH